MENFKTNLLREKLIQERKACNDAVADIDKYQSWYSDKSKTEDYFKYKGQIELIDELLKLI